MSENVDSKAYGQPTLVADEKHVPINTERQNSDNELDEKAQLGYNEDELDESGTLDPFVPFNDLPDEPSRVLTFRAIFLGCCCGALVNASNVYLGLKSGWTFSANLFGAIIGFAVLKGLAKALPENFPILGGTFGPRENNIVQTAATAAGGLSSVFISGIPAMYALNLLATPKEDFWRLVALTAVGAYFGFAFATPMRKLFIIYLARELKLVFPTPLATSLTIRSMHAAATGEAIAKLKMRALSYAFSFAFVLRVVSQYCAGILWNWDFFNWVYIWSGYKNKTALLIDNWSWQIQWTPAFIGAGMLVGLNTSLSMWAGSFLAYAVIGPILVYKGIAFGRPGHSAEFPMYNGTMGFMSLSANYVKPEHPSPRFWLLWPGVLLMLAVSFTELGLQYKIIALVGKAIWRGCAQWLNTLTHGKHSFLHVADQNEEDLVEDSAEPHQQVKWWMWFPFLILMIILSCVVLGVQYQMPVGMSLLSVFLAFFFAFLAVQCTGVTDITPLTAASKASQLILGGATKSQGWLPAHAQRLNLIGGSLASMGAGQAADLVSDFRVGFLLRTPPNQQWLAQLIGTGVAVFLAPALFMIFNTAYPCIIEQFADPDFDGSCPFGAPSVAAWVAVARAVTLPVLPVPRTSGIFAICLAVFGVFMTFVKHYAYRGRFEKYRIYHPNMMCIGLAFVLQSSIYSTAMAIGSIACYVWEKRGPKSHKNYAFPVAAGFIAGEGIGGLINAIFQIIGISGSKYGAIDFGCDRIAGCN
ncbi:Hypothetical protein R9X50_00427000 [Acrodontium crateriforme]|uniref:Oligopeptide transporter n=1 Tax=Acrodontium crateriforme TaxID=150365 RepID=A0AAQ3R894_9PEZI|nr:Hypothetical protein R9X50_00427000 [Acrodontium crateriforme]